MKRDIERTSEDPRQHLAAAVRETLRNLQLLSDLHVTRKAKVQKISNKGYFG